ncbi:orotidine-5'-phosphate decarboxylase [Chlamydiota bacterium]
MNNTISEKIIVALDVSDEIKISQLLADFKGHISIVKIGKQLFTKYGPLIIHRAKEKGFTVFLDLKFHDIPNTVNHAVFETCMHAVSFLTVHTAGGSAMLKEAVRARNTAMGILSKKTLIFGVTVLTSIDQNTLQTELSIPDSVSSIVLKRALLAKKCELDGVIASPHEISAIKSACGSDFLVVTPGIRPYWTQKNDQKRVMTPSEAFKEGADFIVIGRAITEAANPVAAMEKIVDEIESCT